MKTIYDELDIELIEKLFNDNYDFIYNNDVDTDVLSSLFGAFIKKRNFKDFVCKFNAKRHDFISSDREAAAFMMALLFVMLNHLERVVINEK